MRTALVIGLLFLAGALYNLFGPEPDMVEAAGGTAIAAMLIGTFLFSRAAQQKDVELIEWMVANAPGIEQGGAHYGRTLVTPTTVLRRYQVALSFLIVSFKVPSRRYVEGDPAPLYVPLLLSALTLILGWWGIPWGPVYTVQVLASNVRGGSKETAADVLDALFALDEVAA